MSSTNKALVVQPRRPLAVRTDTEIVSLGARILRRLDRQYQGTSFIVLDICVVSGRVAVFSLGVPYQLVQPLALPDALGLPVAVMARPFGCQVLVDLAA